MRPNQYDLLWLNNLKEVFGDTLLAWPFPFARVKGNGFFFKQLLEPEQEVGDEVGETRTARHLLGDSERKVRRGDFEMDPRDYVAKARAKYAGYIFSVPTEDSTEGILVEIKGEEPLE